MNPEQPRGVGGGLLPLFDQLHDFLLLMWIESLGLPPPTRPSLRADLKPSRVRSLSMARSNSANEPIRIVAQMCCECV